MSAAEVRSALLAAAQNMQSLDHLASQGQETESVLDALSGLFPTLVCQELGQLADFLETLRVGARTP